MDFAICVLTNVCIAAIFKLYPRYQVNTFNAIVINYTICLLLGSLLNAAPSLPFNPTVISSPWFIYDVLLGVLFITGFNLTAFVIRNTGITLTTMMQKMSLILTVPVTVIGFSEPFGWLQGAGIALAVLSIVAINQRKGASFMHPGDKASLLLFLVLLFSSAIEVVLFYVERSGVVQDQHFAFTTHGFGCAAVIGWAIVLASKLKGPYPLTRRDVLGGIVLGIPNFFSIYLLLRMLNHGWNGAMMYPLVNVSVLLLSTLLALLAFGEKLQVRNWVGIGLAILAITMIGYAQINIL